MEYLITAAILVAMTVTPLPMPPSWLVLAYLSVELDARTAGIVVAGALGAAAGRTLLAAWTRALGPRLMSRATRENVDYLGRRLHGRRTTAGVAGLLALSPPPSGALYTAAGVLRVALPLVAVSCFAGRLVTYGLGAGLAGTATGDAGDRLRSAMAPWQLGIGLVAVVAALWLLGRIDWRSALAPGGSMRRLRLRRQNPLQEADAPDRE